MRRLSSVVLACLLISACSSEMSGPEPALSEAPEDLATAPSFVCNEDPGLWVTLDGEDFSPLVFDAIASDKDHDVELPTIALHLRQDPTGEAVDEDFSITLESPPLTDDGAVRWLDDETMQFYVSDELELPEGLYAISVENPNGTVIEKAEAFGVIDRPSLHAAIPELTCVAQGQRDIVLEGDNLMVLDEQTPTLRLGDDEVEVIDAADCRELHSTFAGHRLCQEVTVRLDEGSFEAGVYDVTAENFAPAGCASNPQEDGVTVTINDPPQPEAIAPTPICSEQLGYEAMEIDGRDFVILRHDDGDEVYPTVEVGDRTYDAIAADGCENIETATALGAQRCTQVTIAIEADDLAAQVPTDAAYTDLDIVITNPAPVGCHSTDQVSLTAVPPPSVQLTEPDPMCTEQFENTLTVTGHGFVSIDGAEPMVHLGDMTYEVASMDDCTDVPTPEAETASCETVTVVVPQGELDPERTDVIVENPDTAACKSTEDATVQVVPPPTVISVSPQPICTEQNDRTLEVEGEKFLDIDGALPTVTIGEENFEATGVDDCDDLPLDEEQRDVRQCSTLMVIVDAGSLATDVHDIVVTNPEPAHCASTDEVTVETVDPPVITSIDPRALCTDEETMTFDLTGENLYRVGEETPQIVLDGTSYETTASDCAEVDEDTEICSQLAFDVETSNVGGDIHSLVAVNPDSVGCESEPSDPILVTGPPEIVITEPEAFCEEQSIGEEMTLFGQFVYEQGGDEPHVEISDETTSETANVLGLNDCETTDLGDLTLETCVELDFEIPAAYREQEFDITVTSPEPLVCGEDSITIEQQPSPTVATVTPLQICSSGGVFTITGDSFSEDADVYLDNTAADEVTVTPDGTEATATFLGPIDGDTAQLEFVNPGQCSDTHQQDIDIINGPRPVYVDPPAAFDGMQTQITIYATGLDGRNVENIDLIHPDGSATPLSFSPESGDRPHILQATVPEGMLDDSEESVDFGIRLTDDEDSCSETTDELLTITSELTVAIDTIAPPFGTPEDSTSVVITAVDPLQSADMTQFEATPRAYLSSPQESSATEIRALQFLDETELNGIVPSGLTIDNYDLIVVNPDGSVGVLEEAFAVTEDPAPLIDSVSPGSWTNDEAALPVTIEGENFRPDPEVEVFCLPPGQDETDEDQLDEPNEIVITDVDDDEIQITVDTNNLDHLSVCFVRVTNTDTTFGEYSPVTVTNPAGNFVAFQEGAAFDLARRAPTAFSGVPSRQNRYLYVVGGDDGDADEAFTSGEFASLGRFGQPRNWRYLPFDLPSGRSLANGIRVDDFVYLVGGSDEGTPTTEVLRAHVLDPLEVPEIVDVGLDLDEENIGANTGLEAGVYYYRVSAVFDDNDPVNPDGESIASEPQPLNLPLDGFEVTIGWEPPENDEHLVGYRVYRSVDPDDPYGDESLLVDVDATTTSHLDDGSVTPSAGVHTIPTGSLGTWHHFTDLEQERMVAGIDAVANPADTDEHLVYVVGGEDSSGGFRADYEYFSITVDGPRQQSLEQAPTVGQQGGADLELPGARGELQIGIAHERNAASVAGHPPQLFVIGGQSEGADSNRTLYVATVSDDGSLSEWTALDGQQQLLNDRYGHAGAVINDNLVVAGGQSGNPSEGGRHAGIECDDDCPPATVDVPPGWTDLGAQMTQGRVWMGHLPFRGFWYLTGGMVAGNQPTNTVDYTVAGGTP